MRHSARNDGNFSNGNLIYGFFYGDDSTIENKFIIGHNHKNMAVVAYHQEIQVFK